MGRQASADISGRSALVEVGANNVRSAHGRDREMSPGVQSSSCEDTPLTRGRNPESRTDDIAIEERWERTGVQVRSVPHGIIATAAGNLPGIVEACRYSTMVGIIGPGSRHTVWHRRG